MIHDYVTETYYIMSGSGTFVTGGSLGGAKPTDLSNVNAGMSQTGARIGGEARRVKPGDIVIVPAGTPHSFSELDGPIEYLVYRFEPTQQEVTHPLPIRARHFVVPRGQISQPDAASARPIHRCCLPALDSVPMKSSA